MKNMLIYPSYGYILKDTCALTIRENFDKFGDIKTSVHHMTPLQL